MRQPIGCIIMNVMIGQNDRRYQVFISSTFEDLQEERQQVLKAVLEMKAFPSGMELFPSADDEQWAFIQREIESSDYYVVIAAGKYGSLASDGLSFTEKEYDHAVASRKCVMGFVRHDLLSLPGRQLEQDPEKNRKLEAFHQKIKRSRLVKFYQTPVELKSLVMQALVNAFQLSPQEGWVRARNARRLEDLEELARLQKQVMELQAENTRLKADPTAPFAQGDDPIEFSIDIHIPPETAVTQSFVFRTSWNELLSRLFHDADPQVSESRVRGRTERLIRSQMAPTLSAAEPSGWDALFMAVKRQFLGLGLIDVLQQGREVNIWELTEKGRLQLLAVSGLRRP
jgi:hypothetical protein